MSGRGVIPSWCQFHQHFTYEFFVLTSFRQLFSSYMYVTCTWKKLPKWHSYKKHAHIKLMKLTVGVSYNMGELPLFFSKILHFFSNREKKHLYEIISQQSNSKNNPRFEDILLFQNRLCKRRKFNIFVCLTFWWNNFLNIF